MTVKHWVLVFNLASCALWVLVLALLIVLLLELRKMRR